MAESPQDATAANERLVQLLGRCALRDRKAFEELYHSTSAHLYGLILRILINEEWSRDCLQEAYIKIWNSAGSYHAAKASPMTWMMTVARNQALDQLRRRHNEIPLDSLPEMQERTDNDPAPLEQLRKQTESRALAECLAALNEQSRQAIALAYMRGLTHEQLATQMDSPLGSVKTWVRRGLQQLKRCLES